MQATCLRVERRSVPCANGMKFGLVLDVEYRGLIYAVEVTAGLRTYYGVVRNAKLRTLQATMPSSVTVIREVYKKRERLRLAEHDLRFWAEQAISRDREGPDIPQSSVA